MSLDDAEGDAAVYVLGPETMSPCGCRLEKVPSTLEVLWRYQNSGGAVRAAAHLFACVRSWRDGERVQVMGECRQPTYQLVLTKLTCDCNDCRLSTSAKRRGRTLLSGVVSIVPKVCVASRRRHSNRCRESVGWHGVYTEQHGEQVTAPSTGQ